MAVCSGVPILVPESQWKQLLEELHAGHQRMAKIKNLAHSFFWWPVMEAQIKRIVRECEKCQQMHRLPLVVPLHLWSWPNSPWSRILLHFAGLLLVNAFGVG